MAKVSPTGAGPSPALRDWWILACAALAGLPFLFVSLPPLIDVPGHLAQYTIAAADSASPLRHFYGYRPVFVLNIAADMLVQLLRGAIGLRHAVWLVSASIPVLTIIGICAVARQINRDGAWGLPWAFPFAWAYPYTYGFLNYTLIAALSLIGFATWLALRGRPALRAAILVPLQPILIIGHAVGGLLLPLMIGVYELAEAWRRRGGQPVATLVIGLARTVWPLLASVAMMLVWIAIKPAASATNLEYSLADKGSAILKALRDQNELLDIGSVAAALLLFGYGCWRGARPHGGAGAVAAILLALFLILPGDVSGVSFLDMRLVPIVAMTALAFQDWSRVPPRTARVVAGLGLALFVVRMAVTTVGFVAYEARFDREAGAIRHIAPGSRVLNLTLRECGIAHWRTSRLDHFSSMALVERQAWVNSNWDVGEIHDQAILYRPSPAYYNDPSQYVWPVRCLKPDRQTSNPIDVRRTIEQTMPRLPLDKVDYLWLIDTRLPRLDPRSRRLRLLWTNGDSALYATGAPPLTPRQPPASPAA